MAQLVQVFTHSKMKWEIRYAHSSKRRRKTLTNLSLLLNMDIAPIGIIRLFPSKKCPKERPQVSFLEA